MWIKLKIDCVCEKGRTKKRRPLKKCPPEAVAAGGFFILALFSPGTLLINFHAPKETSIIPKVKASIPPSFTSN
jgi:hypothetical protein